MRRDRVAGIDGLRALAVLAVVAFHAHFVGADLGWAGVELFFVISGFLITRILLDLRSHPRYLQIFYARRALRILPVYYAVLLLSVALAALTGTLPRSAEVVSYVVYVQNYVAQIPSWMAGGIPLTAHTWTLAVEEQFYWLWPLVILAARGRALRTVIVSCIVGAPLARLALLVATGNPYASAASLPAQVDALGVGALLALAEHERVSFRLIRTAGISAFLGGGLVIALLVVRGGGLSVFADTRLWAASPINALLLSAFAVCFGGLVAITVSSRRAAALLEWRPLAHVGRISYGLYIYNPLALVSASLIAAPLGHAAGGGVELVLGIALTYLFALVSWRYLESPILRQRSALERRIIGARALAQSTERPEGVVRSAA